MPSKLNATPLLEKVLELNASDLLLSVSNPPVVRISGVLQRISDHDKLTAEDIEYFLTQILKADQKDIFEVNKEIDFSVALGMKARFRVNAFFQRGYPSVAMRTIPMVVPRLDGLNLPETTEHLCKLKQGLIMVVGPTGHGKSTTIAAMIESINETRAEHIVTIEDPIEYIFTNKQSLIEQREMYLDTHSWDVALKSVLRQDPNIVMVGEMRDAQTMSAVLQISETGHLVFATLHTNSAAQTIERIIVSFPESKQGQVRQQLAQSMEAVLSQRLLIGKEGGLVPATEILLATSAVRNLIREGKTHMIDNVISTSLGVGMQDLEHSLANLIEEDKVDLEEAMKYSSKPDNLRTALKQSGKLK
jgi:twitching motility protein PilT